MPKPQNGAGGPFYCIPCGSSHVTAISAIPWRMECLDCGSHEIGIRKAMPLTAAARWLGLEYHTLSLEFARQKPPIRPAISGARKLFKLSDIETVWHKLQQKEYKSKIGNLKSRRSSHALSP